MVQISLCVQWAGVGCTSFDGYTLGMEDRADTQRSRADRQGTSGCTGCARQLGGGVAGGASQTVGIDTHGCSGGVLAATPANRETCGPRLCRNSCSGSYSDTHTDTAPSTGKALPDGHAASTATACTYGQYAAAITRDATDAATAATATTDTATERAYRFHLGQLCRFRKES